MSLTWRDHARPIIAKVIREIGTEDIQALRKALREAYPFGERKYHPYRIWCDEIRVQLGEKTHGRTKEEIPGQTEMFKDDLHEREENHRMVVCGRERNARQWRRAKG